jgi:DNA uptake protein ComE-like DNA-binding protein
MTAWSCPFDGGTVPSMHETETRALKRATTLLLIISLARLGWASRTPATPAEADTVLPDLLDASREAAGEEARRTAPLAPGELIDPNRADEIDLDRLHGIGPSIARAISEARDDGVVFRSAEDLLSVRGIGPATLEGIRPSLDLSAAPPPSGRRSSAQPDPVEGGLIDVNRADLAGLQRLPGIGPAITNVYLRRRSR